MRKIGNTRVKTIAPVSTQKVFAMAPVIAQTEMMNKVRHKIVIFGHNCHFERNSVFSMLSQLVSQLASKAEITILPGIISYAGFFKAKSVTKLLMYSLVICEKIFTAAGWVRNKDNV